MREDLFETVMSGAVASGVMANIFDPDEQNEACHQIVGRVGSLFPNRKKEDIEKDYQHDRLS